MAIVINGSGTVTGLAVGGLPDGTVDAGTLATNSVDSAELIDGAVDDSHIGALAASKLTGALPAISAANLTAIPAANITGTLPAISGANLTGISGGKLLQIQYVNLTTEWTVSGTTQVDLAGLTATITPASTSSKIICMLQSGLGNGSAGSYMTLKLYRDSTQIAHRVTERNSTYQYQMADINYVDSPSTTSATTYKITAQRNASGSSYLGINATTTSLVLMEIE
jgi:hypothetical protein